MRITGEGVVARLLYHGGIRLSGPPRGSHRENHRPSLGLAPRGTAVSPYPDGSSAGYLGNRCRSLLRFHTHPRRAVSFLCRCPPSREVPCGTAVPVRWAELPREYPGSPPPPHPLHSHPRGLKTWAHRGPVGSMSFFLFIIPSFYPHPSSSSRPTLGVPFPHAPLEG